MTRKAWALLGLMALVWGIPYLLIRVALGGFSPLLIVEGRVVLGAAVLLPLAWRAGALGGWRELIGPAIVIGILEAAVPFSFIAYGEQFISSSLTGLLIASVPLLVALLAAAGVDAAERPAPRRLAGILAGFLGVAAILGLDLGGGSPLVGAGLVLGAAASYAVAILLIRRWFGGRHALFLPTTTVVVAAILLAPVTALGGGRAHATGTAVLALVVLGLVCTAGGFVGFFALIAEAGAGRAAIVSYLNPLVAVALGAIVLHERLTVFTFAGTVLILGGAVLASLGGGAEQPRQTTTVVPDPVRSG